MKNCLLTCLVLSFIALYPSIMSQRVLAQQPSLQDTSSWLINTLESQGISHWDGPAFDYQYQTKLVKIDGCNFEIRTEVGVYMHKTSGDDDSRIIKNTDNLSLGDLDPSKVVTGQETESRMWFVSLGTTNEEKKIANNGSSEWFDKREPFHGSSKKTHLLMYVSGEETAKKVVKAFTNAIKQCGGKTSIY